MRNNYSKSFVLKNIIVVCACMCMSLLVGCRKSETYADYLEAQEEAIDEFVSKNNIKVVGTMPEGETSEWMSDGQKVFYLYNSGDAEGLYYHQVELGTGDMKPQNNYTALVRYRGSKLSGELIYACTVDVSPDPVSFVLLSDAEGATLSTGFQQAVKNLRVGGHCQVIIPFSIGNSDLVTVKGGVFSDSKNRVPMFYDIWLVGLE
ncbi:MAG: DUF4827 family protein [Paludibacteraceae bacterium]|nr:DUF4827 family protein [Paludibacteraceae bacterium]MEE3483669.1 DUF4827 family protein [Bacteroidales bacterium]